MANRRLSMQLDCHKISMCLLPSFQLRFASLNAMADGGGGDGGTKRASYTMCRGECKYDIGQIY